MRTLLLASVALPVAPGPLPNAGGTKWHLATRCKEGDVNALFQFRGVWHLMSQWQMRPHTSIGHQVSTDLVHWTRVADALSAGADASQQCFDGSASLVEHEGVLQPMLMIDGGCGLKGPGRSPCMESTGDDTGGVTAFPANLSDPHLTNWTRRGPTTFKGCNGSAGPGPIWRNGDRYNLIAIHGSHMARFESTGSLASWAMADPAFLPKNGGGGALWHALPPNVDGVEGPRWATHICQVNVMGDGRPTFSLGVYDPTREAFENVTEPLSVDVGSVAYGQLSHSEPGGDSRVIHISWLIEPRGEPPNPDCTHDGIGILSSLRDMRFDPRIMRLVESPVAEYASLRSALLFRTSTTVLDGKAPRVIFSGEGSEAMDMLVNISVPSAGGVVSVGVRCSDSACEDGLRVAMTISGLPQGPVVHQAPACDQADCSPSLSATSATTSARPSTQAGLRQVTMQVSGPGLKGTARFPLLPQEEVLPVRVMTDHQAVEVFAADGRGVFTGAFLGKGQKVTGSCEKSSVQMVAEGWAMGSVEPAEPEVVLI